MHTSRHALVVNLILCGVALAEEPAEPTTLDSLKKEQQQLRVEVEALRGEIRALTALVQQLRRDVAPRVNAPAGPAVADLDKKLDRVLSDLQTLKAQPSSSVEPKRPALELVGKPAPAFEIKTRADLVVSNAEFGNYRATVLNFVAPNCGFCQRQLPKVESVRQEFEPAGVRFINISEQMGTQTFTPADAEAKYSASGSGLELVIDNSNALGTLFSTTAYPTMFVVRADGVVQYVNIGAKENTSEILKGQLAVLLGESKPTTQPERAPAGN